ncbi:hypothetical protein ABKV19_007562 [Rosa sericea]
MLHHHIFQNQCTIATLFKTTQSLSKANSLSTNGSEDEHAPTFQDASPTPAVVVESSGRRASDYGVKGLIDFESLILL